MITAADFVKWINVFGVVTTHGGGPISFPLSLARGGTGQSLSSTPRAFLISDSGGVVNFSNSILVTETLTGLANPGRPGLTISNSVGMTYPSTPFNVVLGYRFNGLMTTAQTINSGGTSVATGTSFAVTYDGAGTNDISTLNVGALASSFNWSSSNTAAVITGIANSVTYRGSNQAGRITTLLAVESATGILNPPSGSTATVTTFRGFLSLLQDTSTTGATGVTKNITNFLCHSVSGQSLNSGSGNISNITNFKLYDGAITLNGAGAGSQVNITNLYGLHLQAPTISGTVNITNRYGIKQDDTSALNVFAGRLNSPSLSPGLTSVVTAAGTTTLTVLSNQIQLFTGTTTQTVVLPVVSTLVLGQSFKILNNSTGVITIQSSGGNVVRSVQPGTQGDFYCVSLSGTDATSWYSGYVTINPIAVPFTPTMTFATPGDLSVAYAIQTGNYYRFGNAIFITVTIRFTATYTTASGEIRIGGLPVSSIANWVLPVQVSTQAVTFNALGTDIVATVPSNYFRLNSQGSGAAASVLTTTNFVSGVQYSIIISGFFGM